MVRGQRPDTRKQLARRIHSSRSRIVKMEKRDPKITVDLLIKSLLASGMDDHIPSPCLKGEKARFCILRANI